MIPIKILSISSDFNSRLNYVHHNNIIDKIVDSVKTDF